MPVEIRELIIRAVATGTPSDAEQAQAPGGERPAQASSDNRNDIIEECVRQVLRILQQKKER
jgi:hypothetical protein